MTQEHKDILLKDLCARLPYYVKAEYYTTEGTEIGIIDGIYRHDLSVVINDNEISIFDIKPYLFPMSSMTEEMWDKEFREYSITEFTRDSFKYGCETLEFHDSNPNLSNTINFINKLLKNHFDIYGLIPMGLAIDATGLNIYWL